MNSLINLLVNLFTSYKYVFSTAVTSNADFDNNVDPDSYSLDIEKLGESSSSQQNLTEKTIDTESHQKSDDFCITLESKDSLPSTDFNQPSIEEKLSQVNKESFEFSNLHNRPTFEDSKTTKSPLVNLYYLLTFLEGISEENVILVLKCYCLLKLKCADLYYQVVAEE
jgi:hypothetical protein